MMQHFLGTLVQEKSGLYLFPAGLALVGVVIDHRVTQTGKGLGKLLRSLKQMDIPFNGEKKDHHPLCFPQSGR